MAQRLAGKVALITGANSGFGKAMAMHFGRNGWRVAVTGRRPDAVKTAAEDVRKAGAAEALELTIDVAKPEDFEAAVARIEKEMDGLLQQLGYIAAKMDAIQEGERTLLDNTMLLYTSSMLTGNHDASQLPVVLLGGAGGRFGDTSIGCESLASPISRRTSSRTPRSSTTASARSGWWT